MKNFKIKLIKSALADEVNARKALADFVLQTQFFSMGPECQKFEESFAEKQERKYAIFVNSGSSANLILIQALLNLGKLRKGDKVGISAITWATNVAPLIELGLEPVAIDCEIETMNISSRTLAERIGGLKALFITNALGYCGDLDVIKKECESRGIVLLEDNCESLGSRAFGTMLGNFGIASTFSFFLGHHLSTLEGGMVVTDSEDLRDALIVARAHGWDRQLSESRKNSLRGEAGVDPFYALYTFYDLGYNVRPTEINGFLGNLAIKNWDKIVAERENNFKRASEEISANKDLLPLDVGHMDKISSFAIPVIAKDRETFLLYRKKFEDDGVEVRPIIAGDITKQPFFKKYVKDPGVCKNASTIHETAFYFGNHAEFEEDEKKLLLNLLRKA